VLYSNLQNSTGNHTVRGAYAGALKTWKGSDRYLWLAQCNANGPALTDQNNTAAMKEALFVASIFAGNYKKWYLQQYLYIGETGGASVNA
jgi:hypothetical protein